MFKRIRFSVTVRAYLIRLVLPITAIGLFIIFNSVYNAWADLTQYNLIRRSVASLGLGAILFGPAVLLRVRRQTLYLGLVWIILGGLFIANLVYSRYAGGFLSISSISYLGQVADTAGSIKTLLDPRIALFLLPGVIFLGLVLPLKKIVLPQLETGRWFIVTVLGSTLLVSSAGYGYVAVKEFQQYGDLSRVTSHPFDSTELVRKIGIANYGLVDSINYLRRKKSLTTAEIKFIQDHKQEVVTAHEDNDVTGILAGRNVVFLQLESFQQFLIGREINGQAITPNLNRLANEGRQYTNFHYSIGPGTSSDGEFVTLNSLLHLSNQAVAFDYPANNYEAYPELLQKAGYKTVAYHADSKNFWNRANVFPHYGIGEFIAEDGYKKEPAIGFGLNDKDFFADTAHKIAALKPPFYAHAISLTSHGPFDLPKEYQTLDLANIQISKLQQDYLQAAHYTDEGLGIFMDKMQSQGLLEKIVFVIMGDHEGFITKKDDVAFARFLGYENGFDDRSFVAASRIPFMIYAPGSRLNGADERLGGQVDVYPTLMNLLGQKVPSTVMGVDLFGNTPSTVVKRQRSLGPSVDVVMREDTLYTAYSKASNRPACYQGSELVHLDQCDNLLDAAVNRARISDLVIMGNRLDLLK